MTTVQLSGAVYRTLNFQDNIYFITSDGALYRTYDLSVRAEYVTRIPAFSTPVTEMVIYRDGTGAPAIFVFTEEGMWTFDTQHERFLETEVKFPRYRNNGLGATVWRGDLYIPSGVSIYRYSSGPTGVLSAIGLDINQRIPWEGQAEITKLVANFNSLLAFYTNVEPSDIAIGTSYVLSWDGVAWQLLWVDEQGYTLLQDGRELFINGLGYLLAFIVDTNIDIITLPLHIINPTLIEPNRRYDVTGELITPWFDAFEAELNKVGLEIKVETTSMSIDETFIIEYALDYRTGPLSYVSLGTINTDGTHTFPLPNAATPEGILFRAIRFKITAQRGDDNTRSPDMISLALEYTKVLETKWGWLVQVDLNNNYNGKTPEQMRQSLITAAQGTFDDDGRPERLLVAFNYRRDTGADSEWPIYVEVERLQFSEDTGDNDTGIALLSLTEI